MPVIRTIRAFENETVEVQWTCRDGRVHIERYSIPPKPVRQARWQEAQATQGDQKAPATSLDAIGGPGGKVTTSTVQE